MILRPIDKSRETTNDLYELRDGRGRYLVKAFCGSSARRRRDRERGMLELWRRAGFDVPQVFDRAVAGISRPHLVMTYVAGPSLQEILRDRSAPLDEKLGVWMRVLAAMRRRHEVAFQRRRLELFHPDGSTGNVIPNDRGVFFLDLEAGLRSRGLRQAAAVEINKICRWAIRDLGARHSRPILASLVEAYADRRDVLEELTRRVHGRPLQAVHRWHDRRRKANRPGEVTKYDIADGVRRLLGD